ncbi:MAG: SiaB family protein kinase [Cytophagales bacterium]
MGISNTKIEGGLNHVHWLHSVLQKKKIILAFEGGFTQSLTKNILALTEQRMNQLDEDQPIKKKVFNVMVECLQNICKHADEIEKPNDWMNDGIFVIGKDPDGYFLVTGNFIKNDEVPILEAKIAYVNSLEKEDLARLYKTKLQSTQLSEKSGAGLGVIDIARQSGHKLQYQFLKVDPKFSFYILTTKIEAPKHVLVP